MPTKPRFIFLVKYVDTSASAAASTGVLQSFEQAVLNATTGAAHLNVVLAAQGPYDYIIDLSIDVTDPQLKTLSVPAGELAAQQVALAVAARLSKDAGVTTETVPVFEISDQTLQAVVTHWCTTDGTA
jgi:hypothetical protein